MTAPLILQIQADALNSESSVTDALRKAKVACVKLGLTEFEKWIDSELNGYKSMDNFPGYRKLSGEPEGYNPYWGWQPIIFKNSQQKSNWSIAPIGMSIGAIEHDIRHATGTGAFSFPYPPEIEQDLRDNVNHGTQFRIKLSVAHCGGIIHAVRDVLLKWTLDMEAQGITGDGLMFSHEDKEKSESITKHTVNTINIHQVGAFALSAEHSVLHGSVEANTGTSLAQPTLELVRQIEALLPVSQLPAGINGETQAALGELKKAASEPHPDNGLLRTGLESLKRILAPAGETLLKLAVDAAITKLLNPH